MKKLIGLALFIGLLAFLYGSCPEKQEHTEALTGSVNQIIDEQVPLFGKDLLNYIPGMSEGIESLVDMYVTVDNYYLFSLGKFDIDGVGPEEEKIVSLGIGGHVFTFNDKIVQETGKIVESVAKESVDLFEKGADLIKSLF